MEARRSREIAKLTVEREEKSLKMKEIFLVFSRAFSTRAGMDMGLKVSGTFDVSIRSVDNTNEASVAATKKRDIFTMAVGY